MLQGPEVEAFDYDPAQNLLARGVKQDGLVNLSTTPEDGAGRNRPGSVGGIPLEYDANGNLTRKGDLHIEYDYRNRPTCITDDQGVEIASYTYDAFNRRVSKSVSGSTSETVWSAWRPIEEYQDGSLVGRRIHGSGLDEIVREQADLDGDGSFETEYTPLYDSTGNLVALTGTDGSVFERCEYTAFGGQVTRVDAQVPQIDQVLFREDALRVEFSETMDSEELGKAVLDGRIRLEETSTGTPVESEWVPYIGPIVDPELSPASGPSTAELAILGSASTGLRATAGAGSATSQLSTTSSYESPQQIRRFLLRPLTPPASGTEVRLVLEASALVDLYGNAAASGVDLTFAWPSSATVLSDTAAPEVQAVRLRQGHLEIELTEEPDLGSVQTAVDVGQPVTWTLLVDGFTLRTDSSLAVGPMNLTVGTGLLDLAGTAMAEVFNLSSEVTGTGHDEELFEQVDTRRVDLSSVRNVFGFHGLPKDAETGLLYVRNRYYDPELGRFITADPMGYVDGPSMYQFAGYSPVNFADPLGLEAGWIVAREHQQLEEAGIDPYRYGKGEVPQEVLLAFQNLRTAWTALGGYDFFGTLCFPLCPPTEEMGEQLEEDARRYLTLAPGSVWYEKFPEAEAYYEATEPIRSPETLLPTQAQVVIAPLKPLLESTTDVALMLTPMGMVKGPGVTSRAVPARSAANAKRLRAQLIAEEISQGHAFEKHVLQQGEFRGLGIRTRPQFQLHIENVILKSSSVRYYRDGRVLYLQESTGTAVVWNPATGESTAFQPASWSEFVTTKIPKRTTPYP